VQCYNVFLQPRLHITVSNIVEIELFFRSRIRNLNSNYIRQTYVSRRDGYLALQTHHWITMYVTNLMCISRPFVTFDRIGRTHSDNILIFIHQWMVERMFCCWVVNKEWVILIKINRIVIKIYCIKQLNYNTNVYMKAGTFIYIYLTVSIARMLAARCKRWDLTVDVDSLSLLTKCRRVPLVLELPLWLTVGWSWLVNRAVRPERSLRLLSNVYFCRVVDNKNGWTSQTAEFVDERFTPRYNRFIYFLL